MIATITVHERDNIDEWPFPLSWPAPSDANNVRPHAPGIVQILPCACHSPEVAS